MTILKGLTSFGTPEKTLPYLERMQLENPKTFEEVVNNIFAARNYSRINNCIKTGEIRFFLFLNLLTFYFSNPKSL